MDNQLLTGKLVRLTAQDIKHIDTITNWNRDTEYVRLLAVDPVKPATPSAIRTILERNLNDCFYSFGVRTLTDDKPIGFVILLNVNHVHAECSVGIGIGDGDYRGKGYGSDAMNVVLRFAFDELNLNRVSLDAVGLNARAIRSYEKVGFVHEGQTRGTEFRDGRRDNLVCMGILRTEWQARQKA